jgi:hypothetical protein
MAIYRRKNSRFLQAYLKVPFLEYQYMKLSKVKLSETLAKYQPFLMFYSLFL